MCDVAGGVDGKRAADGAGVGCGKLQRGVLVLRHLKEAHDCQKEEAGRMMRERQGGEGEGEGGGEGGEGEGGEERE